MKTIRCHPDNLPALEAALRRNDLAGIDTTDHPFGLGFRVCTNKILAKDKPTGRYILPSGKVVERDQINLRHKFVIYGPEDADLLVYMKYIREEREMLFYVTDDSFFTRARYDFGPIFNHLPLIHQTA